MDLTEKQIVKELMIKYGFTALDMTVTEFVEDILPSAQPEPCEDPRADVYYLAEKIGIHQLYALVVALRGEPDPCEDAVSRADVEVEIANILKGVFVEYQDIAKKAVAKLPSVTPKLPEYEDAVSRKSILDKIKEVCFSRKQEWVDFRVSQGSNGQRDLIIKFIESLPSIHPRPSISENLNKCLDKEEE